jgi:beta-galactosidase
MSCFSGIVDVREHIRLGGYPAPFAEMLGLRVDDFMPLGFGDVIPVQFRDASETSGRIWSELIRPGTAEVLATFDSGTLKGKPAVTRNRFGKGSAEYVGTILDDRAMAALLKTAWTEAGVKSVAEAPDGVEVVRRQGAGRSFLFVLNHRKTEVHVKVGAGLDLVSGEKLEPHGLRLPAYGVAVIAE